MTKLCSYAIRIAEKDKKQVNFGDIVLFKDGLYAVCTWTVKPNDPGFMRGVLLAEKGMLEPFLDKGGRFQEVKVDGQEFCVFPWLDAPINVARVEQIVSTLDKAGSDILYDDELRDFDSDFGKPHPAFQDALISWMNKHLLGDVFAHLDDLEGRGDENE